MTLVVWTLHLLIGPLAITPNGVNAFMYIL